MACRTLSIARTAVLLIIAGDTASVVLFSKRKYVQGVAAALMSCIATISIMKHVDAHTIAAASALSIPLSLLCTKPCKMISYKTIFAITFIMTGVPIGVIARDTRTEKPCPRPVMASSYYGFATIIALGILTVPIVTKRWLGHYAHKSRRFYLPLADGFLGTATTLSAELVSYGMYGVIFTVLITGVAALTASATSLRINQVEVHTPIAYATWAAGCLFVDAAMGHPIKLSLAFLQVALSTTGVWLTLQ